MKIDFMTKKEYQKEEKDIKLIIIAPTGTIYQTTITKDGTNMQKNYNLDFYPDNYQCTYHIDYLQVFLNNYLKENPNYKKLIGLITSDNIFKIIDQLLKDGYIIFSNNTNYQSIHYQLNGTEGELYINWPTITIEQENALSEIEEETSRFNTISISKFTDYKNNQQELYIIKNNDDSITNKLLKNKKIK